MSATHSLNQGDSFPFDATDEWMENPEKPFPVDKADWSVRAARGVLADLTDRRGIKNGFENIDEETRKEIVQSLAEIIRLALQGV